MFSQRIFFSRRILFVPFAMLSTALFVRSTFQAKLFYDNFLLSALITFDCELFLVSDLIFSDFPLARG